MTDPDEIAKEIVDWLRQNMDITSPTSCWKTEDELERKISKAIAEARKEADEEIKELTIRHEAQIDDSFAKHQRIKELEAELERVKQAKLRQSDMKGDAYNTCLKLMEENKSLQSQLTIIRNQTIEEIKKDLCDGCKNKISK